MLASFPLSWGASGKANTDPLGAPLMAKSPKNLSIRGTRRTRIISAGIRSGREADRRRRDGDCPPRKFFLMKTKGPPWCPGSRIPDFSYENSFGTPHGNSRRVELHKPTSWTGIVQVRAPELTVPLRAVVRDACSECFHVLLAAEFFYQYKSRCLLEIRRE